LEKAGKPLPEKRGEFHRGNRLGIEREDFILCVRRGRRPVGLKDWIKDFLPHGL